MAECFTFINNYPIEAITPDKKHLIPSSTDCFQFDVKVKVRGFNVANAGQKMPGWLELFTEQFGGRMQFTDAYTFHVMKHFMLSHTGENPEDW